MKTAHRQGSITVNASGRAGGAAFFRLTRAATQVRLALVDRRGTPADTDFRRYTGVQREAVRDFAVRIRSRARTIAWEEDFEPDRSVSIIDPDPRLLDLAAASGMLVDEHLGTIRTDGQEGSLVLRVTKKPDGDYRAALQVGRSGDSTDEHGELSARAADDRPEARSVLYAVSPCHVVVGNLMNRVRDLGPEWYRDIELAQDGIAPSELPAFLSFAFSHLTGLDLELDGYAVSSSAERPTTPALIFSEIDAYGYLHVRPVTAIEGFPPGFLDDHEITRIAAVDQEERTVRISDIVFLSDPEEQFRSMLALMGKADAASVFEERGRFILSPELAERFLTEHMSSLISSFALFESEKLSRYKIRTVTPRIRLRLSSGIDFLEGSADVELVGEKIPYSRFLSEYREHSYITLSDGTRAYPQPRSIERLERLIRRVGGDEETVSVSFFDYPALNRSGDFEVEGEAWTRPEVFYRGYNDIAAKEDLFGVEGSTLRPYQQYGVKWIDYLREHELGGCLADEMGLGKTVQTIALLRRTYADGQQSPSLIVVPKSLLHNWQQEFRRFAPELTVTVRHGSDRREESNDASIVITTYAILRLDIEELSAVRYYYVVLDESQSIKNLETKTTKAALSLQAQHRLALSGTPVENSLDELYSLFGFLNRGLFGTQSEFMSSYVRPIREQGDEEALRDLRARIYPFVLRRTKHDVLPDLPEKTEQVAMIELDADHLAAYHRRRAELAEEIGRTIESAGVGKSLIVVLQALTELRQLASVPESRGLPVAMSAKREYLREVIPEIVETGHKCLIFANYLSAVDLVSEDLAGIGMGNLVMTGSTTDRSTLVGRFQNDPQIKAFIMTLKTGGLGLNLTAADYVFIFDPWWNRSAEAQAIARTHRIGQRNPVFAYRLIAKDTIEEKMLLLQQQKAELISSLITSDADACKRLDESDIEYLLG